MMGTAILSCLKRRDRGKKKSGSSSDDGSLPDMATAGDYSKDYETRKNLGRGAFGVVYLARKKSGKDSGEEVVVKFVKKTDITMDCWTSSRFGPIPTEILVTYDFDDTNIIKCYGFYENAKYYQILLEHHGQALNLREYINLRDSSANDERINSYIFRQLLSAVGRLHDNGIVHRDLKAQNTLINDQFHVKLIDFGSAAFFNKYRKFPADKYPGTWKYCSPEVVDGRNYNGTELDMWALGITLYLLIYSEYPWAGVSKAKKANWVYKPPFEASEDVCYLISWLLDLNPRERARCQDIANNVWVTQKVSPSQYTFPDIPDEEDYIESPPESATSAFTIEMNKV